MFYLEHLGLDDHGFEYDRFIYSLFLYIMSFLGYGFSCSIYLVCVTMSFVKLDVLLITCRVQCTVPSWISYVSLVFTMSLVCISSSFVHIEFVFITTRRDPTTLTCKMGIPYDILFSFLC